MPHQASAPILCSFSTPDELVDSLAHFIIKAQRESIEKKGKFTVAISGGSLPKQLNGLIGKPGVKWDKWSVIIPFLLITGRIPKADWFVALLLLQASVLRRRTYRPPRP